jgi:hypothetical protein
VSDSTFLADTCGTLDDRLSLLQIHLHSVYKAVRLFRASLESSSQVDDNLEVRSILSFVMISGNLNTDIT